MRFNDITKTILIILIFILLYFSTILTGGLQKIKDDWPQYRCLPTYMPLAGYIGKDPVANFSYCVGNIQKDMMGFFLEPIQYVLAMAMEMIQFILERINVIRVLVDKVRNMATGLFGNVYGMFVNVLIQFQKLIIKTKDTIMKLIGTITMFIYLIQGAMMTGQSLRDGPIGQTLETICFSGNTPVKLKNGDIIDIDAKKGTINVRLTKSQLISRKKKWRAKKSDFGSGTLWKYAQTVGPAYLGAPTHPGKKKEVKEYSKI